MKISEKINAEYINNLVFKANDAVKNDSVFYKSGLLLLSGNGAEIEKKIKRIDRITGVVDYYIIKNEMKRALLYTALLRKKIKDFTEEVDKSEVILPVSN